MSTTITISGPGSVINFEYYLILKALRDVGITVLEDNDEGHSDVEKSAEYVKQLSERLASGEIKDWTVQLKAKHLPWGG